MKTKAQGRRRKGEEDKVQLSLCTRRALSPSPEYRRVLCKKAEGDLHTLSGPMQRSRLTDWFLYPQKTVLALLGLFWLAYPSLAVADLSAPAASALVQGARFDQNLGVSVPLDAMFRDEHNQPVALRSLLGKRPVVLVMGYHDCPMLCSLVLTGTTEAFTAIRETTGKDFDLIDVSISPKDQPDAAAKQKRVYYKRYLRLGADSGWHFLTSPNEATIKSLTDTVGFHYAYDAASGQYAHPSGLVILTPEGKVSGYLFGVNFDAGQLSVAIQKARQREVGSPIAQLLITCFHYNPVTGKYGALVLGTLRAAGVLTVLLMAGGIVYLIRRPLPMTQT